MSRFMLIGVIAVVASGPAFALNDTAGNTAPVQPRVDTGPSVPGPSAVGPSAVGPYAVGPTAVGPSAVSPCHKVRAQLSPEERARRKELREQRVAMRAAQGLPPRSARSATPRVAKPVC